METYMGTYAELSCVSCRRLKRKCSKDLPSCSLCSRVGRACIYQSPPTGTDQADQSHGQGLTGDAAPALAAAPVMITGFQPPPVSSKSPLVHSFLDSVSMRGEEPALASGLRWQDLHQDAVTMSLDDAWGTAGRFFATTYDWLPIVSKIRLFRTLSSDVSITSADIQVLLHAMRLSTEPPSESRHRTYGVVKTAILNLEQYASFSTNFLAAYALLALHELGQGVYPAAYITVGNLARVFYALGFHDRKNATQMLRRSDTWTETEERRRIWWAVLIFDRYVHVGLRFRPLSTPNIPADELLPANDDDWDSGPVKLPLVVLFPLHSAAGTYAWYARESGAEKSLHDLTYVKGIMGALSSKWGVASQYLEILEGQEYSYDGADCQ
ncbi:hypothetical protein Q7P37_001458 [Cladosporium fusiforme]